MLSNLGGIFSPQPARQAEQADTRQAIQRHEQDQPQRRRKKSGALQDIDENGATVAVEALREFLEKIIRLRSPSSVKTAHPDSYNIQADLFGVEQKNQQTVRSAEVSRAASAYQHSAQAQKPSGAIFETTDLGAGGPEIDLSAGDTRTVLALIEDLKLLGKAGVEYIHIQRAETFLQSLVNAVADIKGRLP